jgi:hypothetical protein
MRPNSTALRPLARRFASLTDTSAPGGGWNGETCASLFSRESISRMPL